MRYLYINKKTEQSVVTDQPMDENLYEKKGAWDKEVKAKKETPKKSKKIIDYVYNASENNGLS